MRDNESDLSHLRTIPVLQAGRLLGMGKTQCYEAIKVGTFPVPVLRIGRQWRVRIAALEAYFQECEQLSQGARKQTREISSQPEPEN